MHLNNCTERSREIILKCFSEERLNIQLCLAYLKYFVPKRNVDKPECQTDIRKLKNLPTGFENEDMSCYGPLSSLCSRTCQSTHFNYVCFMEEHVPKVLCKNLPKFIVLLSRMSASLYESFLSQFKTCFPITQFSV